MLSNGAKRLALLTLRQGLQGAKSQAVTVEAIAKDATQASSALLKSGAVAAGSAAYSTGLLNSVFAGSRAGFDGSLGSSAAFRRFSSGTHTAGGDLEGLSHLAMLATDKDNTATAAAVAAPTPLDAPLSDASATLASLPNPVGDHVAQAIASGSDLWATVPLMSLNLPALDATTSVTPLGMCAVFAMLAICANHNTNHLYAPAGTNVAASLRKSLMGFWNEQVKERALKKWRDAHMVSTPMPSANGTDSPTTASNRIISNWIAAREWAGMGTLSWITSLFAVILASNTFGLIPFSEAITGRAGLTLGLSFAVWGAVTYTAIATQGTKTVNLFLPGGINWQMAPFFVLLEMISYSFRAVSLGVRLWANMLAGHQLIHIVTGISLVPVFVKAPTLLPVSLTACGLLMAMTGLESIVCLLQSGVFCLLTSFYLAEALHKKTSLAPQPLAIKA